MSVWRLSPSHPDLVVNKMQHSNSYLSYQTSRLVFLVPWYWAKWLISQICPPYSELTLVGDQGMPPPLEYLAYLPPHTIIHARMHACMHTQIWHISYCFVQRTMFLQFLCSFWWFWLTCLILTNGPLAGNAATMYKVWSEFQVMSNLLHCNVP